MGKLYRFTLFNSDPDGHGGEKRTAQISELLEVHGYDSQIIPSVKCTESISFEYMQKWIKAFVSYFRVFLIIKKICHPRSMYRTIRMAAQLKNVFNIPDAENDQVILWESTRTDFAFVVPLFKKKGYRIIAIPHNIESLVPLQISVLTRRISPQWFMDEINMFRHCDRVFAISKEETLLLNQFGIKASYLPYYPPDEIFERLLRIRNKRERRALKSRKIKRVLLLGSAVNPPTREGIINRINFFNNRKQDNFEIIIAGYATEQLKSLGGVNGNILFYGELTNEELTETLCDTDVFLVHQSATSGALTRIIEALIAGIPVLANFIGARDYYEKDGAYVYYDDAQLIKYLAQDLPIPSVPEKPLREYECFRNSLKIG